jgi:hypothetical protein
LRNIERFLRLSEDISTPRTKASAPGTATSLHTKQPGKIHVSHSRRPDRHRRPVAGRLRWREFELGNHELEFDLILHKLQQLFEQFWILDQLLVLEQLE